MRHHHATRLPAVLAAGLLTSGALTGCTSGAGPSAGPAPVTAQTYGTLAELRDAVTSAGVPCDRYTERYDDLDDTTVGYCDGPPGTTTTLLYVYPTARDAALEVIDVLEFSRGLRDTLDNIGWDTGPGDAINVHAANWVVQADPQYANRVADKLGGTRYGPDGPDPTTPADPDVQLGDPDRTRPTPPSTDAEGCLDDCTVTRDRIITDLQRAVCQAWDPAAAATDDLTGRDPYQLHADTILACTAGGSADLTTLGVLHLWNTATALEPGTRTRELLEACPGGGATVIGYPADESAYAVVGIRTGPDVVDQLVDAGATHLCG